MNRLAMSCIRKRRRWLIGRKACKKNCLCWGIVIGLLLQIYAPETFGNVAAFIMDRIRRSEHVFAHIYQDREQLALTEELCPGVTAYRNSLSKVLDGSEKVTFLPHEELISKLDSVSKLYQVVVIKTALTLPYTSIFFELDCKYWDAVREVTVRKLSMDAVDNH